MFILGSDIAGGEFYLDPNVADIPESEHNNQVHEQKQDVQLRDLFASVLFEDRMLAGGETVICA